MLIYGAVVEGHWMAERTNENIEEDGDFEDVQETFGFFDPKPADTMGIAAFIPRYVPWDPIQIARAVAHQARVGTVVKNQLQDGNAGESMFGFTSVLNIGYYYDILPTIASTVEWMKSLNDPALNELLANHRASVGIFFNERAIGVPYELSPHILRSIFEEIQWATEDIENLDERRSYNLTHLIMIKKVTKDADGLHYPTPEDELFFQRAGIKVEVPYEGEEGDLTDEEYHRYLFVVSFDCVKSVRDQINAMFNVDESNYADEALK